MKTSDSTANINKSMAQAQSQMRPASKDANNPHFKSKFTSLLSVWESIRDPLTKNGITVWQDVVSTGGDVSVFTRLSHISGEWVEFGPLTIPLIARKDAQAIGSAISYAKRYSLCAAVGVVSDEDDDGEAAVGRNKIATYDDGEAACGRGVVPENSSFTVNVPKPQQNVTPATGGRITLDQIKELTVAVNACADPAYASGEICRVAGISDISKIPSKDFAEALTWVKSLVKKAVK